jgi:hypothetical protein
MNEMDDTTSRRGLLVGLVLGLPIIAYGIRGALVDADDTHPRDLAAWVVGLGVLDDFVVIPLALAVGWVARRFTPRRAWPPVRAGLFASAVLVAVAWPTVRGFGDDPHNPSLFPRNYTFGLLAALAVVWLAVGAWLLAARRTAGDVAPD